MKVCVTLVGVCRPSFSQIKSNIEANILYFTKTYPLHTFDFIVLTYKNTFHEELYEYTKSNNITCILLEQITNFIFPVNNKHPNIYRLFYSMNEVMNSVSKDVDCVIRVRLDAEVLNLELTKPEENTYYGLKECVKRVADNIGYGTYKTMMNIWKHENCLTKGSGAEEVLYYVLKKNNYRINDIKFHYKLYQSDSDTFDGVRQWSKRSREWIYDGKNYILRDL